MEQSCEKNLALSCVVLSYDLIEKNRVGSWCKRTR